VLALQLALFEGVMTLMTATTTDRMDLDGMPAGSRSSSTRLIWA
jgi:hypothetical protein